MTRYSHCLVPTSHQDGLFDPEDKLSSHEDDPFLLPLPSFECPALFPIFFSSLASKQSLFHNLNFNIWLWSRECCQWILDFPHCLGFPQLIWSLFGEDTQIVSKFCLPLRGTRAPSGRGWFYLGQEGCRTNPEHLVKGENKEALETMRLYMSSIWRGSLWASEKIIKFQWIKTLYDMLKNIGS